MYFLLSWYGMCFSVPFWEEETIVLLAEVLLQTLNLLLSLAIMKEKHPYTVPTLSQMSNFLTFTD